MVTEGLGVGHGLRGMCQFVVYVSPLGIPRQLLWGAETQGVGVEMYGDLHAPAARVPHGTHIAEGLAHQQVGRYGRDGIVEVLHFHRGQRHFLHETVSLVSLHRYPVARAEHVVGGELHPRHQAEDSVPEDESHDSGRSAQSRHDGGEIGVHDNAHHDDDTDQDCDERGHLVDSLQGAVSQRAVLIGDVVEGADEGGDKQDGDDDQIDGAHLQQKGEETGASGKHQREERIADQRGDEATNGPQHAGIEQVVVPLGGGLLHHLEHKWLHHVAEGRGTEVSQQADGAHAQQGIEPAEGGVGHARLYGPALQILAYLVGGG